jgi:PKD repeat protein
VKLKKLGNKAVSSVFGSILFLILVVTLASILFFALYRYNSLAKDSITLEQERMQERVVLYALATQNVSGTEYVVAIYVNNSGSITSRIRAVYVDNEFLCDPSNKSLNPDDTYVNAKESLCIWLPPGVEYDPMVKITVATERGIKSTEYQWKLKGGGGEPPDYKQKGFYYGPLMLDFNKFYYTECPSGTPIPPWKEGWRIEIGTGEIAWNITVTNVDDRNITINQFSCFTLFPNKSPSNRRAWYLEPLQEPFTQFIAVNETVNLIYIWDKPKSISTKVQDVYTTVCRNKVFLTFFGIFHEHDGTTKPYGQTIPFEAVLCVKTFPVAKFTESAHTVYTGEVITFNASNSFDPDGQIVSYFWDFGDGANETGVAVGHAYADDGTYTVRLKVTDNDNKTDSTSAIKTVLNRPPTPSFMESAETVYTGDTIHFNASESIDPDGYIVSYLWHFGDETNATGVTTSHSYAEAGIYTVTLTLTDDDGDVGSTSSTKTVLNRSPVVSFTESATVVLTGEPIYFDASGSYDPDGIISSYLWSFGDGSTGTGKTVDHWYVDNGIYTVTLTVVDNDGGTASASDVKTVLNRPPVALFSETAETVHIGEAITFNASGSYDPDGHIVSYFWDFGDGTNATGVVVSHAYSNNGTYTVELTVTDDDGSTASATAVKTVLINLTTSFTQSAKSMSDLVGGMNGRQTRHVYSHVGIGECMVVLVITAEAAEVEEVDEEW